MFWILIILGIFGFIYFQNQPKERVVVERTEICGKNKIVVNGICVCDESSGYYPAIGNFETPDHDLCNACDKDSVKLLDGVKVCDPHGMGAERQLKERPPDQPPDEPSPAEPDEQCGNGQVLGKDSKCEPATAPATAPDAAESQ